jgi:hypothetical protein
MLNQTRGAGYWVWKPLVIWQALLEAADGDTIMYADAATEVVLDPSPLFEVAAQQHVVGFGLSHKEKKFTKRDTFVILNGEMLADTDQVMASFIVFRRSLISLGFVSQWLGFVQDKRLVSDQANELGRPNYPEFVDHRHDQSVFSILYKLWNFTVYPDPSQWGNHISTRPYGQIINHHRERTR